MSNKSIRTCAAALFFPLLAGGNCSAQDALPEAERHANMMQVCQFIKACPCYFIATLDGDQPRVRPFGTIHVFEGKLYIQTGKKKNVAKQMMKNGKVELCAFNGKEWIRLSGTLVNDDRREAKVSLLDAYPSLKTLYSADDDNTMVLYFTDAEAVISSFTAPPKVLKF